VTAYGLDPLGQQVMLTIPGNDRKDPVMHLFPDQMEALDGVEGYLDELMAMYPDHKVTERSLVPNPGLGETLNFGMKVGWESYEVVVGLVLDPIAQTAVEMLPWTEGALWTPGGGVGLTVADAGWFAATEKFQQRPMWQQMIFGAVFDPFVVLAGLGLLRHAKLGSGLTVDVIKTAIRKLDPSISQSDLQRAADRTFEGAADRTFEGVQDAGAGGWRGTDEFGEPNMPRKHDGSYWEHAEILERGGAPKDVDGPLGYGLSDVDYERFYARGLERIKAEENARLGMGENYERDLREVLERIANPADQAMERRVVDQLAPGVTDPAARAQIWSQFVRTAAHALNAAQLEEGGSRWVPSDFGQEAVRVVRAELEEIEAARIARPEGRLTTAPDFPVAAGPGAPVSGVTRLSEQPRRLLTPGAGDAAEDIRLRQMSDMYYGGGEGMLTAGDIWRPGGGGFKGVPRSLSQMYEEGQALFLDKFAAGNAASGRANKRFLDVINNHVDRDIVRVNKQIVDDFMDAHNVTRRTAESDPGSPNFRSPRSGEKRYPQCPEGCHTDC